ncbi:MAG: T9SS type A sorting domain-containing protein, partial [Bacteroidetes bacterium]|nr:T9SS type A sorting domain-containing protein [Bacteroidota bacterium]
DVGEDPMANQVDNLDDCAGTADGILDQLILNVDQDYQWQVNKGIKGSSFNYAITVMPSNTADITATNGSTYGCNNIDLRYLAKNGDVGGDGVTISNAPPSFYDNGYVIAPTGYTISGQSSFSKFRLHSVTPANVTLPVELLSLVAYGVENKYINVDWATATEINNEGFDIERSTNGVDFYKVGYMQGNGNSSSTIDYRFEDYEVQKDIVYYYRLKQVDYNGEYEYSPIVNASLKGNNDGVYVSIYPNPSNVREEVIVEINSNMDTDAEIVVSDIIGKLILSDGVSLNKGINKYTINNGFLAVGQYFVTVKMPQQQLTKNVIVTE